MHARPAEDNDEARQGGAPLVACVLDSPLHCDLLIGLMPHLHLLTCIGLHTQFFCAHILGPLPPPHISAHVRPRPPTSAHVNDARFSSVPGGS